MYPVEIPTLAAGLLPPLILLAVLFGLLGIFAIRQRSGQSAFRAPDRGESFLLSRFLRNYWYWLMRPIEEPLVRRQVRPELINYLGLAASAASGVFFAMGRIQSGGLALLASGCLDMIDGQVARRSGQASLRGAFLDSTLDRYAEFFVYLGLMFYYQDVPVVWLGCALAMGGSFIVSYCRARGEALGVSSHDVGMMQRAERLALLITAAVLTPPSLSLQSSMGLRPGTWLMAGTILVLAAGTNITGVTRFRHVLLALDPGSGTPKREPSPAATTGLREPAPAEINVGTESR